MNHNAGLRNSILTIDNLIHNNNSKYLLSAYYIPGATLNVLGVLTELFLTQKYE